MADAPGLDRRPWPAGSWILLILLAAAALVLPAVYNRFPLIFPDTAAYLGVAYGHYWTLDRSGFYGLALKPIVAMTTPVAGLWLAIALQSIAVAGAMLLVVRRLAPGLSPWRALALVVATVLLTSLPWHAAQLMPDAVTGIMVLLTCLAASSELRAPGTALLWLVSGLLALMHYTHLGLFVAVVMASLTALALTGISLREIGRRAAAAVLVAAAVASAHVAVNGAYFNRWTVAPMGPLFLFARLNEDGLVPGWLDRHCGRDAPPELCTLRASLPRDSQVLLWGGRASPLTHHIHDQIGSRESWRWIAMLDRAAMGSIGDEPVAFIAASIKGGARQMVHWQTLDDECPNVCRRAMTGLIESRPALRKPLGNSRQWRGEMNIAAIRWVTAAVALIGQILLVPALIVAVRCRDRLALSAVAAIMVALLANAAMAGALSDVHDRYQSRLVWLAPFVVLILSARWGGQAGRRWRKVMLTRFESIR